MSAPALLFVDQSGELGGAELALLELAARWPGRREVILFADGPLHQRLRARDVPVSICPLSAPARAVRRDVRWPSPRAALALAPTIAAVARRARGFDALLLNTQKALVVGGLAARCARRPALFYLHDILSAEHFSATARRVVVHACRALVRTVIANSQASREAFVSIAGAARRPPVLYNAFDAQPILDAEPIDLRAQLGVGAAPLFGVFGRLAPWKGQHVVLDAIARVPDAHVALVGGALFGEEAYAAELRARAQALGVAARVHFLGFRDDVGRLMKSVDGVIHSSTAPEPFGRVIVEAMLAARPVVATDSGGVREIVRDGVTGWLVPAGDAAALAAVLRAWQRDAATAVSTARRGHADAVARFAGSRAGDLLRIVEGTLQDG